MNACVWCGQRTGKVICGLRCQKAMQEYLEEIEEPEIQISELHNISFEVN